VFISWGYIRESSGVYSHPFNLSKIKSHMLISHEPIAINSNEDFADHGFPGSGTNGNPYIIDRLNITVSNYYGDLISISGTNASFVVRNNNLNGSSTALGGIILTDVQNGRIDNNTITDVYSPAIALHQSRLIVIENNILDKNSNGIRLENSASFNVIRNNEIFHSTDEGIILEAASNNNSITFNLISQSGYSALAIDESSNNQIVKWNSFLANQRVSGSQAFDSGNSNLFSYNHWDDWTYPDENNDGIVDIPYQISGYGIINLDQFPLVAPIHYFYNPIASSTQDVRFLIAILFLLILVGLLGISLLKQRSVNP
jgi:parallel beta-helix repeat protein